MAFDLEETVTAWKNKYGDRRIAKKNGNEYPCIPIRERKELLRHLVFTFKNKGEDKDFFKQQRVRTVIAEACFPPVIYDKESRKRGYEAVWRELKEVVSEFWPDPDLIDAPERQAVEEYNPAIHSIGKELDRSIFNDAPKPKSNVDKEAAKLLGFDDE